MATAVPPHIAEPAVISSASCFCMEKNLNIKNPINAVAATNKKINAIPENPVSKTWVTGIERAMSTIAICREYLVKGVVLNPAPLGVRNAKSTPRIKEVHIGMAGSIATMASPAKSQNEKDENKDLRIEKIFEYKGREPSVLKW